MKKILVPLLMIILFIGIGNIHAAELKTGWYTISPQNNVTLRLSANSTASLKKANNSTEQKFYLQKQSDGSYKIGTGLSGGTSVIASDKFQKKWDKSDKQKWLITSSGDNYTIKNKSTGKYFSFSGTTLNVNSTSSLWKITPLSEKFTVTFKDEKGNALKRESVASGKAATAPTIPAKTGYTATWDVSFNNITKNITVKPKYTIKTFTVTFKTKRKILKTEKVEYGKGATAPTLSSEYTLLGWDKSFNKITADTTVTADFLWRNNGKEYYYKAGVLQKGLHKINGTWYLFNKSTGAKEQTGKTVYLGSFFQSQSNTATRFFITLDGYNFRLIDELATKMGVRDMSLYVNNGTFYGVYTGSGAPSASGKYYDFCVMKTTDLKNKTYNAAEGAYVDALMYAPDVDKTRTNKNRTASADKKTSSHKWAPEWFIDGSRKYVFYTAKNSYYKLNKTNRTNFGDIYRTEYKGEEFSTPVKMNFDKVPGCGFIDAQVIKKDSEYVMFVKNEWAREWNGKQSTELKPAIYVYKSTDLTNWKFWYTISKDILPQPETANNITRDGKKYHTKTYYEGEFCIKIGNTYHLYADIMQPLEGDYMNKNYSIICTDYKLDANGNKIKNADGTLAVEREGYLSQFVHLTSTDLKTWKKENNVNTYGEKIRHGSLTAVTDSKSIDTIQKAYNI